MTLDQASYLIDVAKIRWRISPSGSAIESYYHTLWRELGGVWEKRYDKEWQGRQNKSKPPENSATS